MKSYGLYNLGGGALTALLFGLLLTTLCATARAQVNSGDRTRPPRVLPPESSSRPLPGTNGAVIVGSDSEAVISDPTERKRAQLLLEQIQDDFSKIQLIHNQMMERSFAPGRKLDYGYISETTAEMRKRANRLKNNLRLPASESVEKERRKYSSVSDEAQLKKALTELDELLMSFVGNQLFQKTRLIDVELSNRAQRDLLGVIEFSQGISKDAERLGKTNATH